MTYFNRNSEGLENKIKQIFGETVAKEGNKFTKALMAARENGKKFFAVNGKQYETESYKNYNEEKDDFKPHMMYDPKTGKGTMAKVMDDHLRMKKMGYSHEKPNVKETNKNDKSDDGEGMDAVQPKAVKKKFADRKDKDIDNDGDTDSTDKYLHKRRKAISKAIKNEDTALKKMHDAWESKHLSMKEALKQVWENQKEAMNPAQQAAIAISKKEKGEKPKDKQEKTMTGKKETKVEVNPKV